MIKQTVERITSIGGLYLLSLAVPATALAQTSAAETATECPAFSQPLEQTLSEAEAQIHREAAKLGPRRDNPDAVAALEQIYATLRCVHEAALDNKQRDLSGRALFRMANIRGVLGSSQAAKHYQDVYPFLDTPFFTQPREGLPFANYAELVLDSLKREGILIRLQVRLCEPDSAAPRAVTSDPPVAMATPAAATPTDKAAATEPPAATTPTCRAPTKPIERFEIWQDGHEIWRKTAKPSEYPHVLRDSFDLRVRVPGLRYDDTPLRAREVTLTELQKPDVSSQVAIPALYFVALPLRRLPVRKNPWLWVGLGTAVSVGAAIGLGFALKPPPNPRFVLE